MQCTSGYRLCVVTGRIYKFFLKGGNYIVSDNTGKMTPPKSRLFLTIFIGYIALVLWIAVFSRSIDFQVPQLDLLWSYKKWLGGDWRLGKEIIANIGMLIPFGFLLSANIVSCKKSGIKVLLAGFLFSCIIEILQYVLWRGLFEFDDVVNNTAGAVLGYLLYQLLKRWTPKKFYLLVNSAFGILLILSGVAVYFNFYITESEVHSNIPRKRKIITRL